MRSYAVAQLTGTRSHQCDATAVRTAPNGARAYVLLDGIGSSDAVRAWTRTAAARLAQAAARRGDAEMGLRAVYRAYAAERADVDPYVQDCMPKAAAIVAVTAPGRPLTIAWCGDSRAYILTPRGTVQRLTDDHNLRRVWPPRNGMPGGNRNRITSCLGSRMTDKEVKDAYDHPVIESTARPAEDCRLLLASDGAYEPHEDAGHRLSDYLTGTPAEAARDFTETAVSRAESLVDEYGQAHADNASALVADLRP